LQVFGAGQWLEEKHGAKSRRTCRTQKHRLNQEHVSGLSQLAAAQDFAAKILCDNLQALTSAAAVCQLPIRPIRRVNRAYAHSVLKPLLPSLLLRFACAIDLLGDAIALIACHTFFLANPDYLNPERNRQNLTNT
jgi:hypothetical protein